MQLKLVRGILVVSFLGARLAFAQGASNQAGDDGVRPGRPTIDYETAHLSRVVTAVRINAERRARGARLHRGGDESL
jgi:hypothetical protein